MKHHGEDIVEDVLEVLRRALTLYYDFKCLAELPAEERVAMKDFIETLIAIEKQDKRG